eukprot:TRINITY_DN7365_c0_g1_i1.p1 TRINITY_DN7365_c0_g1~~TRINITY_DN7365_c0_g1_i1.p1  ORF type:complete len:513 (-),score=67.89 TRINITY_DN7365_c0_g1_i1:189-1727(-)
MKRHGVGGMEASPGGALFALQSSRATAQAGAEKVGAALLVASLAMREGRCATGATQEEVTREARRCGTAAACLLKRVYHPTECLLPYLDLQRLQQLAEHHRDFGIVLNVTWAAWDAARFGSSAATGDLVLPLLEHTYLVDLPAYSCGGLRRAYVLQAAERMYDCSVNEVTLNFLWDHLSFMDENFDLHTPIGGSQMNAWLRRGMYDVPLGPLRKTRLHLTQEAHELFHEMSHSTFIGQISSFTAQAYCPVKAFESLDQEVTLRPISLVPAIITWQLREEQLTRGGAGLRLGTIVLENSVRTGENCTHTVVASCGTLRRILRRVGDRKSLLTCRLVCRMWFQNIEELASTMWLGESLTWAESEPLSERQHFDPLSCQHLDWGLFIGPEASAESLDRLQQLGIRAVVIAGACMKPRFAESIDYMQLDIQDSVDVDLLPLLPQCIQFIDSHLKWGRPRPLRHGPKQECRGVHCVRGAAPEVHLRRGARLGQVQAANYLSKRVVSQAASHLYTQPE